VEFKQLSNFVVLAEELNFRRAAARLNISQPPLSRQLAALERELGVRLLNRDHRRRQASLTPDGQLFLVEARRILRDMDRLARMAKLRGSPRLQGTIRLGFVGSFARRSLPRLLKASRRRNPALSFELSELNSGQQLNALRRGSLDVAIIRGPLGCPGIDSQTLYEEDLILALPADLKVPRRSAPKAQALAGYTYVQFSPSIEPAVFHQTEARAREAKLPLEPLRLVDRTSALMALVGAGIGVSLIPQALSNEDHPGVMYRPVAGSTRSAICVAWQSDRIDPGITAFLRTAMEHAKELAPAALF